MGSKSIISIRAGASSWGLPKISSNEAKIIKSFKKSQNYFWSLEFLGNLMIFWWIDNGIYRNWRDLRPDDFIFEDFWAKTIAKSLILLKNDLFIACVNYKEIKLICAGSLGVRELYRASVFLCHNYAKMLKNAAYEKVRELQPNPTSCCVKYLGGGY